MGDSSWLIDRLSHPDYNNWVKGNLILQELKTGLVPFLEDKAKDLQEYVLRHVPASSVACTTCTGKDLRKGKYACPSRICTTILKDINSEYTHTTVKLVNTDNQTWCDTARYWEIAKAYISTPGYASKKSAAETDCVGLLTIVINCKRIQSFLSVIPDVCQQVKDIRNQMLHSDNNLDSDKLDDLYGSSLQILNSYYFAVDPTAQTALARITQIKEKTLSVSDVDLPGLRFIVEELEAEQGKHSAEQGKHRESIGHLEQNLKEWKELTKTKVEELANQQERQIEDISQLRDHHEEHKKAELQLGTIVSDLGTQVRDHHEQCKKAVSELGTQASDHYVEHTQALSQLGTTVSELGTQVRDHHEEFKKAESQLGTQASDHYAEHTKALSQLATTVSLLDKLVRDSLALHQQAVLLLGTLRDHPAEHQQAVSQFGTNVSLLDAQVRDHNHVEQQQQAMSQLGTRLSSLEVSSSTENIQTRVQHTLDEHRQEIDTDRRRLTEVQHTLDEHRQEIDTDRRRLTEELDELKNYLVNTKYKVELLQGETNMWFEMKDVLQMFVPLEIREDLEQWMALSSTERKKVRPNQASDGKEITSIHELFFKNLDRQYHIYLLGEAGVGKSTFCHQLVDKWCRAQDSEPNTDYESELKLFEFLFFIQARNSDKSQTVYEMIKKQLCPLKYHKVLEKLFTSHPESCLVLIDGLDELQSGIRGYQELPNVTEIEGCTILITSRHWRVERLDCDLGLSCRVLEIRGLDAGGIENLAVKVFEAFTREDNPSADCKPLVNQFMNKINLLKLNSLAQIPFLLIILIKSWLIGNRNLENGRGFIYSGLIESLLVHSGKKVEYTGTRGDRTNTQALPSCFNKREHCLRYSSLIHELSKLAFNMLFSDENENSLVFRKQDLDQQLGIKEHLTLCLKLGLLTETKGLSETKECQRSFRFPHKSIQEYFSSVYLSGEGFNETGFAKFCERVTSLGDVYYVQNVLLFLSGMNLTHCKTLFDYICNIVFARQFAGERLYPAGWNMRDKIVKTQMLAQLCTAEANHSLPEGSHTYESHFVIPDMVVDEDTPEHNVGQFCRLGLNIKSLVYTHGLYYQTTVTPFSVVKSIRTMQHIQRLGIVCTAKNTKKYIVCICKYLSNLHQLKSFSFSVDGISTVRLPKHVSTELVSKLGTLPNLVSVYFHRLYLSDIDSCQFTSQLTSLGLYKTSLSPGFVSGWCNQLHTLNMDIVDLSPAAVHQLRQYVMTSSSLQSLTLYLPDRYNYPSAVFDDVLDLTSHTSLHTLDLWRINLKSGVRIHGGHNCMKIHMHTVSMSESMWQEFITSLPTKPLQKLDVKLLYVESLNPQTMSYIRDKFCVTVDSTGRDGRYIYFNTTLSYRLT